MTEDTTVAEYPCEVLNDARIATDDENKVVPAGTKASCVGTSEGGLQEVELEDGRKGFMNPDFLSCPEADEIAVNLDNEEYPCIVDQEDAVIITSSDNKPVAVGTRLKVEESGLGSGMDLVKLETGTIGQMDQAYYSC